MKDNSEDNLPDILSFSFCFSDENDDFRLSIALLFSSSWSFAATNSDDVDKDVASRLRNCSFSLSNMEIYSKHPWGWDKVAVKSIKSKLL